MGVTKVEQTFRAHRVLLPTLSIDLEWQSLNDSSEGTKPQNLLCYSSVMVAKACFVHTHW